MTGQGFAAEDIAVLQRSNRLTALIAPCDVVARVAPVAKRSVAELEVEVAAALVVAGAPVAPPDPRFEPKAFESGRFVVTLWTYCHPTPGLVDAREYARALARLHESMREVDSTALSTGRYTDRVDQALRAVEGSANPFDLSDVDRALVANTVRNSSRSVLGRGAPEQLLHGEPHSGNLLRTDAGPLFVDLETCCRGPVEFDIAHATTVDGGPPLAVAKAYPGATWSSFETVGVSPSASRLRGASSRATTFPTGEQEPSSGSGCFGTTPTEGDDGPRVGWSSGASRRCARPEILVARADLVRRWSRMTAGVEDLVFLADDPRFPAVSRA